MFSIKSTEEDIFDSFCYQCLDHVFSDKNTSSHVDNIDYLVDLALAQYSGRRKVSSIIKKRTPVKEILAIALTLFVVLAAIPYILPPIYGDFGSDVSVSIGPENVRDGDSLFVNVTIPSSYRIRSVTTDMAGIETINLSLVDNSTLLHLWQGVWVVHDVVPDEHIMTISALDVDNVSYYAGVRWSILPEETSVDNQSSDTSVNETDGHALNETFTGGNESLNETVPPVDAGDGNRTENKSIVPVGLNLSLQSDKAVYVVNETVSIWGVVTFNNSLINTTISLLINGPNYNLSESLNVTDGRFDYQFIPVVIGSYNVKSMTSYENETVQEDIVVIVQGIPLENVSEVLVSDLFVWDNTDYQRRYVGDLVTFYANYSSDNVSIEDATCLVSFYVGSWTEPLLMGYSGGFYVYSRFFNVSGLFEFRVWCSAVRYENKTAVGDFVVSEVVSNVSVVSIVDAKRAERIYALPGTSFHVERTIDGLNGTDVVFAPLFSDDLTVEKFEIIRGDVSTGKGLEIVRDVAPQVFTPGRATSDVERRIDGLRRSLPANVKQLNRVSYSRLFNLNGQVTVRVWFKAPSWDDIRSGSKSSSGRISYLVFSNETSDFEGSTWWNSNWNYRKLIIVNSSQVDDDLTNFPILVNITDTDLRDDAQDDGDDIAFVLYSDNTTRLNHEIELFNDTTGELFAWVNITSLSSSVDTKIWMYYNNSGCSSQENIAGVWDSNYVMVQHLNETSGTHYDSTQYGNNGTASVTVQGSAIGKIDGADEFDGSNDYIEVGASNWDASKGTVELWGYANGFSSSHHYFFGHTTIPAWNNRIQLYTDDVAGNFDLGLGDSHTGATDIKDLDTDTWYHIALTWNGTDYVVYVDGVSEATGQYTGLSTISSYADIGNDGNAGARNEALNGTVDEVRISNTNRSADWINTCYNNQENQSTFISVASEQILINTSVNTIFLYNVTYSPFTITATNNTPVDNVTLWYRYSSDNNSWDSWVENDTDTSSPWQWSFSFLNGTGYYEFYSIGKKSGSPDETPLGSADAMCHWIENTSIEVTPSQWDVGTTTIGDYNYSTSGYCFNLTNEGNVALNIQIKASNATNATTGARWNLTSTPGYNNFSLQYSKGGGSWTYVNTTYDVFVTNLGVDSWQTFDLNLIMATTASTGDPLSLLLTFRSVAS